MIGKSIRQRLVILTLFVLALALGGSFFIANRAFSNTLRETTYTQLANNATYLKTLLENDTYTIEPDRFDAYARATSLRITIVGKDGWVLYDSDYREADLDNHLYREEVQQALDTGNAVSERRSATQRLPVLYHAIRIDEDPDIAVLRLSTTLSQLTGYQKSHQNLFLGGLGLLVILVTAITAVSIGMITRPLHRIKETAARYANGELDARMHLDGPSEITELATTMQDMATRLRNTIDEVESSRQQVQAILDSMTEGILLVDSSLVIKVANQAAKNLLLQTSDNAQSIEGLRLVQAIRSTEIVGACNNTLLEGKNHEVILAHHGHLFGETALLVGRSKTRILRLFAVPVWTDGQVTGVVLTVNDMTELKRLEQIRKDFVANVSHELKTPITAIAGFSQALMEGAQDNPEDRTHFISIINRQATHMQRIVEDLLLLSSLEQQNTAPTRTWTAVGQIIEETVEACRFRAEQKHSRLEVSLDNPENLEIFANGMLVVQALSNLVVNAITYSGPETTIGIGATIDETDAVFTVSDSGPGIPKDAQQRIFERFYRVDAARSRSQGGTGLGLSIVKHIVGVHGGSVTVDSELGKGSTFTIRMPRGGMVPGTTF